MSPASSMGVIGPAEMAVGAVILIGYTRPGGYVAAIWLGGIAIDLLTSGHHVDVAARDAVMASAAFTLARLAEAGARLATVLERHARSDAVRRSALDRRRFDAEFMSCQSQRFSQTISDSSSA